MTINLNGRVAIVTGAGGGLGREHALQLARRGARVVVNDLGGARDGRGGSSTAADAVVEEIRAAGGEAIANGASVTDFAQIQLMVAEVIDRWGRVDILVNNAGILRDRTFTKVSLEDFRAVVDVHLMGAVHCTKAVWDTMREQRYGRIVMTTSSSGLFGNFGQSAYGAAKMGLVGLMNTLHLEAIKYGIHVNCLSPSAATRMTHDVLSEEMLAALVPQAVTPGLLALVGEQAPSRVILGAGAGVFEQVYVTLTKGLYVGSGDRAAESLLSHWSQVADRRGERVPSQGPQQAQFEFAAREAALQPEVLAE